MARMHGKPVIAVPAWGEADVAPEAAEAADAVAGWDAAALLAAVETAGRQAGGRTAVG